MAQKDLNKGWESVVQPYGLLHWSDLQNLSHHLHLSLHLAENTPTDHQRRKR